jgi:hypothetical protein
MAISETIGYIFHEYAMNNYNTAIGISEKYLILSVD